MMRVVIYSTRPYEREVFTAANGGHGHELHYREESLCAESAYLARGADGICIFVGDRADRPALSALRESGVRLIALRSAGFNHVDLVAAEALGLTVLRVPAYSPHAIAEHAAALLLTLNRKTHRAFNRVREQNFALDGLIGFDLHGKTVGVVGTGQIGAVFVKIMRGFGCRVLAFDLVNNPECEAVGVRYVGLAQLWAESDVISLHCPLTPQTRHMVNAVALAAMKPGIVLINTSRGAVIDSQAVIRALKSGRLGALGMDVYEEEGDLFFRDLSAEVIQDDVFARLMTFPNVLITGHQGFFTREAVTAIAETTLANVTAFERGAPDPAKVVTTDKIAPPSGVSPAGAGAGFASRDAKTEDFGRSEGP